MHPILIYLFWTALGFVLGLIVAVKHYSDQVDDLMLEVEDRAESILGARRGIRLGHLTRQASEKLAKAIYEKRP